MSATPRIEICIDCHDIDVVKPFWVAALDYAPDPRDVRGIVDPTGKGPLVWFQVVPEPKTVKDRIHLDLFTSTTRLRRPRSERDVLVAIGARAVSGHRDFWLMGDPEGNEFCLCWRA